MNYSSDDATTMSAETLLRAWFHWWHHAADVPLHLPGDLHVQTAAYLAFLRVQNGQRLITPDDL